MVLKTIRKAQAKDVERVAKITGLKYFLVDANEDETIVIADDDVEQEKEIARFLYGQLRLMSQIRDIFVENGISAKELDKLALYLGCEKEYFPGLKIDYKALAKE